MSTVIVKESYTCTTSISSCVNPDISNAAFADSSAEETVRSGIARIVQCECDSPCPSTHTGVCFIFFALSGDTKTPATAPSVTKQQSNLCNGSAISGEFNTSSIVKLPRFMAFGFNFAHSLAATATSAKLSEPTLYSCI